VDARIHREIRRRRSHPDGERPDVLSRLVGAAEDGAGLTDEEIRDQVVSLIAAGYETTSAALAWTCLALLTDRRVHERARAEARAAGGDPGALPYLDGVVAETLRMYPPAAVSARMVGRGFTFAGHDIEPGTTLLFSPLVTHRMPQLWPEPTRFVPERWDRAAPGFRTPSPQEFLPFGGGAHRCLGAALATMEMTVVLARLLARVDLEPVPQRVRAGGYVAMRPRDGVLARVCAVRR
jgi:cytochrome P450